MTAPMPAPAPVPTPAPAPLRSPTEEVKDYKFLEEFTETEA